MAVYVDELRDANWKYGKACRLTADTAKDLHKFAKSIKVSRMFLMKAKPAYYNLTSSMRLRAIAAGAVMIYSTSIDRKIETKVSNSKLQTQLF